MTSNNEIEAYNAAVNELSESYWEKVDNPLDMAVILINSALQIAMHATKSPLNGYIAFHMAAIEQMMEINTLGKESDNGSISETE